MVGEIELGEHLQVVQAAKAAALEEHRGIERSIFRAVIIRAAVSVPVGIGVVVGVVALAVGDQHPDWGAWLAMAAAVGVIAGAFFGSLLGFINKAHMLDELGEHARDQTNE